MQNKIVNKSKLSNIGIYFISLIIISFTFHNIFKFNIEAKQFVIIFGSILFIWDGFKITKNIVLVFIIFSILIIIQGIMFGYSFKTHLTSFYFNIFIVYIFLRILPKNYYKYLADVILYISIISLLFWVISIFFSEFGNLVIFIATKYGLDPIPIEIGTPKQILIFTYEAERKYGILRNSGFCHEPGAYAVALVYAIAINYLQNGLLLTKKNLFLFFCLITTFSSAGFLSLYFFIIILYYTTKTNNFTKLFIVLVGVFVIYISFFSLDFMNSKIKDQYNTATNKTLNEDTDGRIFASRKAIYVLGKYPLFGRGFITASKVEGYGDKESVGYGFPAFASQIGIPFFILVSVLFYRSLKTIGKENNITQKNVVLLSLAFLPVLYSQAFLPSMLLNMLIFQNIFQRK